MGGRHWALPSTPVEPFLSMLPINEHDPERLDFLRVAVTATADPGLTPLRDTDGEPTLFQPNPERGNRIFHCLVRDP